MGAKKPVAVVVGGSIAGLSCAHALISAGWRATVIEKTAGPPSGSPTGAGLGLDPESLRLVCRWTSDPNFLHAATVPLSIDINRATDSKRKVSRTLTRDEGFNFRAAHWADLHSILLQAVLPTDEVVEIAGDLLVAADGCLSSIRRHFLPNFKLSGNGSLIASLVTIRHRFRAFVCTSSPRRRDGIIIVVVLDIVAEKSTQLDSSCMDKFVHVGQEWGVRLGSGLHLGNLNLGQGFIHIKRVADCTLCRLVERGWHVQSITIYSARVAQRCGASSFIMGLSVASATVATKSLLYHLDPAPHQLGRRQISTLSWTAKLAWVLAGVFRNNAAAAAAEVEEGDEGSGGGAQGEQAGISGENSGAAGRSEEDRESNESQDDNREVGNKRKRKKYHRHTAEQIREMEALFKESPHPDEKQRQQLSKQLGLSARQVKFWFQNRRTQIKERHENSLLKSEIEKLQEENRAMREMIKKACCPNCGIATLSKDITMTTEEQQLRIENARLKAEVWLMTMWLIIRVANLYSC
ncbi:hypothetical protein BHE74_00003828 [Ensete ventricosum]|nr:hypothetical protein BHE74_00003828 [Ensete ventricosum]